MVARLDASHKLGRLLLADQAGPPRREEAFLDVLGADAQEHLPLGGGVVRAQLLELVAGEVSGRLEA